MASGAARTGRGNASNGSPAADRPARAKANGPDAAKVARFVEQVGLVYEGMGLPRMAGRILGHLLVCEPPHQSMSQLQTALQASKGSISTMTRLLQAAGTLERVPVPHDRREYVRMPPLAFETLMRTAMERTRTVRSLAEEGLAVLAGAPAARTERLRAMRDFYEFMERELPRTIDRYRREQDAGRRTKAATRKVAARRPAARKR